MNEINVFEKISDNYYSLTAADRKVADFVTAHRNESQYMSISELAEACGVADATVSRFAKRLNYSGYNAFRLAVARSAVEYAGTSPLSGEVRKEDGIIDMCQKIFAVNVAAMEQTMEMLRPEIVTAAGDLLEKADKVLCMGQGSSMVMAQEAEHMFSTVFGKYFSVIDAHMQAIAAAHLGPKDVILYFSYSGSTRELIETASLCREQKAKFILVTRFAKSPGAELSDIVVPCGANEPPIQQGSAAARIAMIYVLDVLFSEVCRRDLDGCRAKRQAGIDALHVKHI